MTKLFPSQFLKQGRMFKMGYSQRWADETTKPERQLATIIGCAATTMYNFTASEQQHECWTAKSP